MEKIRVVHVAEAAGDVERYLYAFLRNSDSQEVENYFIASQHYDLEKFQEYVSGSYQLEMAHTISPHGDRFAIKQIRKIVKKLTLTSYMRIPLSLDLW